MITIKRTTYTPEGEVSEESITPIVSPYAKTVEAMVSRRVRDWVWCGWQQTAPNQVAKVDRLGYLDVVTFEEMSNE